MIDAIGTEPQFIDHLAPLWKALPAGLRGRFLVPHELMAKATARGIDATEFAYPPYVPNPPSRHDGPLALVASAGDIKHGRRLGYGPFIFLEHGAGQSYGDASGSVFHGAYAGGPDRDDVILNLVPNETCAERWRASYPQTPTVVIGCPKLDTLPRRVPGPVTVAISFHWPASMLISGYAGNALPDFLPQLGMLAKRFNVIGHAHPKFGWPDQMKPIYEGLGIPFVSDFDDVCRQADVYVCDNSSTIFEFAATGRPVVLMNARYWHRGPELGLRFWAASGVGINVSPWEDLGDAIDRALLDTPGQAQARREALAIVYQPSRTGAAKRGAEAIEWWLGVRAVYERENAWRRE